MEDALQKTFYCDHAHPDIQAVAACMKESDEDPVVIALRTFYFVRDRFVFGYDLYQRKASDTLKRGYGVCWNKSLLLVALLRCNRIPARFGSIPVKRDFCKPAVGVWHWLANDPFNHCLVHAYLGHRWTLLDAVLDTATFQSLFRPSGVEWGIDWNGEDDVRLYTESVVGPPVMHPDIDTALNEKVGNAELPKLLALIGNRYLNWQMWKKAGVHGTEYVIDRTSGSPGLF